MLDFIKNKASAAAGYVAEKAKAGYAYAAEKTADTIEWYSDLRVTPREKIGATIGSIAGFGAAWAAFSLGFGSAPVTLTTLAATPVVTTLLTGVAVGTGMLTKKAIGGLYNMAMDAAEDYAATPGNENSFIGRYIATEYQPEFGPEDNHEARYREKYIKTRAQKEAYNAEVEDMFANLGERRFTTMTRPTLMNPRRKPVEYKVDAGDDADFVKGRRTLRSGNTY